MNREPVNPDDPQMTAYALGELSAAEAAEFEARLQDSPRARRELEEMRLVMDLLGEGLRREWQAEQGVPLLRLLEPVRAPRTEALKEKVVPGSFGRFPARIAVAAGIAAMLIAGSFLRKPSQPGAVALGAAESIPAPSVEDIPPRVDVGAVVAHVPQLLLAEEVDDLSSLDLADGEELASADIDTTYLDANSILPASFQPAQAVHSVDEGERVDSYLPPLGGMIPAKASTSWNDRRQDRGPSLASSWGVQLARATESAAAGTQLLGGFRSVSQQEEDPELKRLSDLHGIHQELTALLQGLPQGAPERQALEQIVSRSERMLTQWKQDLSR
jgi:hypothetical protein